MIPWVKPGKKTDTAADWISPAPLILEYTHYSQGTGYEYRENRRRGSRQKNPVCDPENGGDTLQQIGT